MSRVFRILYFSKIAGGGEVGLQGSRLLGERAGAPQRPLFCMRGSGLLRLPGRDPEVVVVATQGCSLLWGWAGDNTFYKLPRCGPCSRPGKSVAFKLF